MPIYSEIVTGAWALLILVWLATALFAKRTVRSEAWWSGVALRLAIVGGVVLLAEIPGFHTLRAYVLTGPTTNPVVGVLGAVCAVLGVALAIWARLYLGRNWGMPMSHKENPELVTSGPYAYIRHPIYSGILLAILGSALASSAAWFIALLLFGIYFVYSARKEEEIMLNEFPATYPSYRARTTMLVPFLF